MLVIIGAVVALAVSVQARVQRAEHRWGGAPVRAYMAVDDLPVGAAADDLRPVTLPPAAVPPTAVTEQVSPDAVLALALPAGAVLTAAHLDPRGPAAGLAEHLRVLPVPVEPGWAITAGAWVDVWLLGTGEQPATLAARSRPVLDVREDDSSRTALVGLDREEIAAVTSGLALGHVLLAHAPAPTAANDSE